MNDSIFSIKGKTALITGGSRGIGKAIAELFAEQGAEVIVVSRKQDAVDAVANEINANGGKAHGIAAHMGDLEAINKLVATLKEKNLDVDILVNNAGISPPHGLAFIDTPPELWDKIMDVNLRGPFFLCTALAKQMVARGSGSIINISTTSSLIAQPEIGAYCVSKAAMNAMTGNLARELGPKGLRINAIACGVINTDMGGVVMNDPAVFEDAMKMVPLKRVGEPSEIASTALFLASDGSSYINGEILAADGGVLS
jgi:NAD(P)-dependent dehydrogenase (short-subunit alcohol dehydrogenase family)